MAIVFMDGFDHYGKKADLGNGTYVYSSGASLKTSGSRTGGKHIHLNGLGIRYALPGQLRSKVGVGFGLYLSSISTGRPIISLLSTDPNGVVAELAYSSDGRLHTSIRNTAGSSSLREVHVTDEPVIVSEAWQHVEMYCDITNGDIEVRVDEVVVTSVSGTSSVPIDDINIVELSWCDVDDFYVWDTRGNSNNDFIGDKKVFYIKPSNDVSPQDWEPTNAATGAEAIGTDAPDDNSYIEAEALNLPAISKFELDDLDPKIASITAVMTTVRQRKEDAGAADTQIGMESNNKLAKGEDRPITTEFTYWQDVFEKDPNTGAAWTPQGLQNARLVIKRTK